MKAVVVKILGLKHSDDFYTIAQLALFGIIFRDVTKNSS